MKNTACYAYIDYLKKALTKIIYTEYIIQY